MRVHRKHISFLILLALTSTLPASDDREELTPTAWLWRHGKSAAELAQSVNAGYRLIDLEVESTSPLRFSACFVRNTGVYSKTWWWYTSQPGVSLASKLTSNNARLICLAPYVASGQLRFAAVMVKKTGKDNKAWWWHYNASTSFIKSEYQKNGARIIDLDTYVLNNKRYYSAITIRNSGADQRSWWWYTNQTFASVGAKLAQHGARLYDIDRQSSGRYNIILLKKTDPHFWWYIGVTEATLNEKWANNGARIFDIETYKVNGKKYFLALMGNNSGPRTTRIGDILRNGTDGSIGFTLKRINGSTRAALRTSYVFDPASTMKTVHHVHAMRRVALKFAALNDNLSIGVGACPYTTAAPKESLSKVLRQMMESSSNDRTIAIERWAGNGNMLVGRLNINNTAKFLGMTNTQIRRTMGCGGADNWMTLNDIIKLHEKVAGGYLGSQRGNWVELMLNSRNNYPGFGQKRLSTVLAQEAGKASLSAAQLDEFKKLMSMAYKPGSLPKDGKFDRTTTGWLSLPFIVGNNFVNKEYVTGVFADNTSNADKAKEAVSLAAIELLRDEIAAAMSTWKGFVFGKADSFGRSCRGTKSSPIHSAVGTPFLNQVTSYNLVGALPGQVILFNIGFSKTTWLRIKLPLSLTPLGAPGCSLYTSLDLSFAKLSGRTGKSFFPIMFPSDKLLIGAHLYTQYFAFDKGANAMGMLSSNAIDSRIGGRK